MLEGSEVVELATALLEADGVGRATTTEDEAEALGVQTATPFGGDTTTMETSSMLKRGTPSWLTRAPMVLALALIVSLCESPITL